MGSLSRRLAETRSIQRGEMLLANIASRTGITPCGKDWLIAALDPLHDNQLHNLAGYPDVVTAPSLIRIVKQTMPLSAPPGQATPWSGALYVWPWLNPTTLHTTFTKGANTLDKDYSATGYNFENVHWYRHSGGGAHINFSVNSGGGLSMPTGYLGGTGRLIGMGLEVINETAEVYQQGNVVTFRSQQTEPELVTWYDLQNDVDDSVAQCFSAMTVQCPPTDSASAMLLPGSRSWEAANGCYMVVPFQGDNKPTMPQPVGIILPVDTVEFQAGENNADLAVYTTVPNNFVEGGLKFMKTAPINMVGAIFENLSPQTALQLNVVWYYENFPVASSDLISLAKPSCSKDSVALQAYAEVLNSLPIAVPSSWNSAGDWFADVVDAVKNYGSKVGEMIGGAPGLAIGEAASTLAGWAQDRNYVTTPGAGGSGVPKPISQQQKPKVKQQPKKKVASVTTTTTRVQPKRQRQRGKQQVATTKVVTTTKK